MGKDPAFLFYSKDWIEGTAEMLPSEKGVYIDLLCYQHQKGSIPNDIEKLSRLARMSQSEFSKIWENIRDKFVAIGTPNGETNGDRLVNKKLCSVTKDREEKGNKNKLIGTFAHVLRKLNLSKPDQKTLKARFNVDELLKQHTEWSTERLTEWCLNGIPFIANGDANENGNKELKKELIFPFDTEEFISQWYLWKEYKKKEHKFTYKTIESEQAALKSVGELSNGSEEMAIKIIHQSIANSWKGLFEIKNNNGRNTKEQQSKRTDFIKSIDPNYKNR